MAFHVPLKIYEPHGLILSFDVPRSSLKNPCLLLYATFKPILVCTRNFWPQTRVHRDVCIKQNSFVFFLIWVQTTWLLAFQMPLECLDLTLHYPFGVLYKEPLGYIEEEELKSKETIVHCCLSWLYLSLHPFVPLEHFMFFPSFPFLVSLLSRDGGLRWWRPRWRTRLLQFIDVPT